jgi:carboxyl-terminal processing protease
VTATREDLQIPSVYSQAFGSALYVEVTSFANDTANAVRDQLQRGLGAGATSIILDLRHNGGGYVTAAQSLASQFLTRGGQEQNVVVRRGRMDSNGDPSTATNVIQDQIEDGGVAPIARLAVIVDADTASAAEIVSAALKDYHRGTLVGQKTFGKGSVQVDFTLPDGNDLHLTVEKWFGPGGESIDLQGITPDHTVALPSPDDRFSLDAQSVDAAQDPQLQAALLAVR